MKRGFTLIELLAMIAVLALLALITLPVVDNTLDKQRERIYEQNVASAKDALRNWANENTTLLPEEGETRVLTLQTLKEEGLIDTKFKNPKTKKCYSNSNVLKIKNVNGVYSYEVNGLTDGLDTDCENTEYRYYNDTTATELSNMNNQPTVRPTNSRVYLKYPMNAPANTLPQVCMHGGYMELCLDSNNYDGSRTIIEEYVSFDPDNWVTEHILTNYHSSSENAMCIWNNNHIDCFAGDQFQLDIDNSGTAQIVDIPNNIACTTSIKNGGKSYCFAPHSNSELDPIERPTGGSIKPTPGTGCDGPNCPGGGDPTDGSI